MKKLVCVLMCVCVVSMAQAIVVENNSFELPGDGKIKGWDQADGAYYPDIEGTPAAEVPGWESVGTVVDSGVEAVNATDGLYSAFMMTDDPAFYQVTGHIISAGESYSLTVDARDLWNAGDIDMALYYTSDGGSTLNELITENKALTGAPLVLEYTLSDAAAVGSNLVILFDDTTGGNGWATLDNVRLDLVPEPATLSLLALGGILLRRKKG